MKLAAKLVIAFVLGMMLLTAVYGYLTVEREIAMFEQDMADEAMAYCGLLERFVIEIGAKRDSEIAQTVAGAERFIETTTNRDAYDMAWVPLNQNAQSVEEMLQTTPVMVTSQRELYSLSWTDDSGNDRISYYYPVNLPDAAPGMFELAASRAGLNDYTSETVYRTVGLMAGMALVGGLLMAVLGVTQVGKPLDQLIAKTRKVASGDLEDPVVLKGFDELSELADALNQMCVRMQESQEETRKEAQSRIEALEQLRHADRLKTVGRLAAGMAHELGTPLSVVSGRASLIASGKLPEPDVEKSAETIKAESDRMAKTIRQLLDFARHSQPQRTEADLRHVIQQTVDLLQPLASKRDITIETKLPESAANAQFDVGQIQQVLTNLIVNATHAIDGSGCIQVELDKVKRPHADPLEANVLATSGEFFRIQVIDQGSGISPEDLPQLFEPFFTTKAQGQGTGLGLSISYGIVQEHGGWIDVQSTVGEGSTFAVYLPAETEERSAP